MRGLLGHEILKPRPDTMFIWENVGYNFWNVGNLGYRNFRCDKNFQANPIALAIKLMQGVYQVLIVLTERW